MKKSIAIKAMRLNASPKKLYLLFYSNEQDVPSNKDSLFGNALFLNYIIFITSLKLF